MYQRRIQLQHEEINEEHPVKIVSSSQNLIHKAIEHAANSDYRDEKYHDSSPPQIQFTPLSRNAHRSINVRILPSGLLGGWRRGRL